jgi:hypothetical protein
MQDAEFIGQNLCHRLALPCRLLVTLRTPHLSKKTGTAAFPLITIQVSQFETLLLLRGAEESVLDRTPLTCLSCRCRAVWGAHDGHSFVPLPAFISLLPSSAQM